MTMKMKNNQVQREVIVQQMKQQWSYYNHCPSWRLFGVEHDYHPNLDGGTSPHGGSGGAHPPWLGGFGGQRSPGGGFAGGALEAKNICKISL